VFDFGHRPVDVKIVFTWSIRPGLSRTSVQLGSPQCTTGSGRYCILTVAVLSAVLPARCTVLAQAADSYDAFQSPSGNIVCGIGSSTTTASPCAKSAATAGLHRRVHHPCEAGWGDRIEMDQGSPPALSCHTDTLRGTTEPPLAYGSTRAAGEMSCDSELSGITCTDASTGHFFRISRDSYELR
jgi:hypothetical protein